MDSTALKKTVVYFSRPGKDNTVATFAAAKERAVELGIDTIVVASTTGKTAIRASAFFQGFKLVVVTHSTGIHEPNVQGFTDEARSSVQSGGGIVHTATHAFGGVGRSVRRKFNTYQTEEIIANTLRVLGEGMKVVCEIALMAADAGLIRTDREVVCIAGTGHGADTAVVLQPANAQDFFNIKINEIICKPHLKL
jgi:hypothetical protein